MAGSVDSTNASPAKEFDALDTLVAITSTPRTPAGTSTQAKYKFNFEDTESRPRSSSDFARQPERRTGGIPRPPSRCSHVIRRERSIAVRDLYDAVTLSTPTAASNAGKSMTGEKSRPITPTGLSWPFNSTSKRPGPGCAYTLLYHTLWV